LKKILIVDDEVEIRDILKLFISASYDNEILEADSGNAAIDVLEDEMDEIAVVLCDYRMKNGNGGVVYAYLKENDFPVPYIMASTDTPDVYEEFATLTEDNPLNTNLKKPFKKALINEVLDKILAEVD